MNENNAIFGLIKMDNTTDIQTTADKILTCNKETEKYGLVFTKQQALALSQTHINALKENKRIAFNGGIVDRLILAFCDSSYISENDYEDTIHDLISLFYDVKNNTWETISDNDLIAFMKNAFDTYCYGSIELLSETALRLCEHIHCGKSIEEFISKEA